MMKGINAAIIALVLVSVLASVVAYQFLPEKIVSHWNIYGNADSQMDKAFALSIMPIVAIFIAALYFLIPKLDPLRQNIKKFEFQYGLMFATIIAFMLYIHIITILWNLGFSLNISAAIIPGVALLLFVIGLLLKDSERNWFVGVRTPWTLSSDNVWKKTHLLASKTFMIAGVILLLSIFFPEYAFFAIIFVVLIAAIIPTIYSYFEYAKEKNPKKS